MERIERFIQRMGIELFDDVWHIRAESFYKDPYESHHPGEETWHHDTFLIPFSNVITNLETADFIKEADLLKELKCHGVFAYSEYLPLGYLAFYVPVWYRDEKISRQVRSWINSIDMYKTEAKYCSGCKIKDEFGCLQCPVYPTIDRDLLAGLKDVLTFGEEELKVEIEKDDKAIRKASKTVYRGVDLYKNTSIEYHADARTYIGTSINKQMICEIDTFKPLRPMDASDRPLLGYGVDYILPGTLKKAVLEKDETRFARKKTDKKSDAADRLIEKLIDEG